jgi:nucleoside-diphosphate-sugar epimerase
MHVVIAGGHGQIALRLTEIMAAEGHSVTGLIRNPDQAEDLTAIGGRAIVLDLEQADAEHLSGLLASEMYGEVDAVVFAAGAGPGSGAERKDTVDRAAAVLLADAAERSGVRRFIQISSMGADAEPDPSRDDVWAAYIKAKAAAEEDLRARDLDWIILRPGSLTNDEPTGKVQLAEPPVGRGDVTRSDVAAVVAELLRRPAVTRLVLELRSGETAVEDAVAALAPED